MHACEIRFNALRQHPHDAPCGTCDAGTQRHQHGDLARRHCSNALARLKSWGERVMKMCNVNTSGSGEGPFMLFFQDTVAFVDEPQQLPWAASMALPPLDISRYAPDCSPIADTAAPARVRCVISMQQHAMTSVCMKTRDEPCCIAVPWPRIARHPCPGLGFVIRMPCSRTGHISNTPRLVQPPSSCQHCAAPVAFDPSRTIEGVALCSLVGSRHWHREPRPRREKTQPGGWERTPHVAACARAGRVHRPPRPMCCRGCACLQGSHRIRTGVGVT